MRVNSQASRMFCVVRERLGGESAEGVVSCLGLKDPPGFKGLNTYSVLVQTLEARFRRETSFTVWLVCLDRGSLVGTRQA